MESNPMEKTPTNAGQDEENINSVTTTRSSDGHEDSQPANEQISSATSPSHCSRESWKNEMDFFELETIDDTSHLHTPVSDLGSAAETFMETNEPDVQLVTERSNVDDDSTHEERMSEKEVEDNSKNTRKRKRDGDYKTSTKSDEKTITVVFHAMLSNKFKLNDRTKIVIRGDKPVFGGWDQGDVPLMWGKHNDEQFLVHGEFRVPLRIAFNKCEYKYVLLNRNNDPTYEEIIEYQPRWGEWGGYVNRYLDIKTKNLSESKIFHRYDGFIYPKPPALWWGFYYSSRFELDDRRTFFRKFFPKWRGFSVDSFDEIQPVEALQNLECLLDVTSVLRVSVSGQLRSRTVNNNQLKLLELFEEILMPKLRKNLEALESQTRNVEDKVHAVVSSVVIAYVFTKYPVNLKPELKQTLLQCLTLPPNNDVCSEFVKSIDEFENDILSRAISEMGQ